MHPRTHCTDGFTTLRASISPTSRSFLHQNCFQSRGCALEFPQLPCWGIVLTSSIPVCHQHCRHPFALVFSCWQTHFSGTFFLYLVIFLKSGAVQRDARCKAGAYYRKGDHKQKKKTGNLPAEFKALRMFPEWERWILPRPTFLAEQLLKEAAMLEEAGEPKKRVKKHNIFEHCKDGFEPHTLPNLPPTFQAFKEYKERSNLNPDKGNLWGCFSDSCNVRERGFWVAALEEHARCSYADDGKVYHAIKFGQEHPN